MKSRARSMALRLASSLGRKAVVIFALSGLVIVMAATGLWAHQVYAAKARIEATAQKEAATLNDVMAKLNTMESEMQQQTRTLNAKLEALEYQNAKLATYEVRDRAAGARLEMAAAHMPIGTALPAAYPQTLMIPIELKTDICHKGSLMGSAKLGIEPKLKAFARVNVGLDEFGDGVEADARGDIDVKADLDMGGETGFEKTTCLEVAQFNIFGNNPPGLNVGQFVGGITTGSQALAQKLAQIFMNLPQIQNGAITTGLDNLSNLNLSVTPQQILQALDSPSGTFQNVSSLVSSIPLPGNLGGFFQDPSSLFPKPSDLDPLNFCATFTGSGLISNICSKIPSGLANLQGVANTVGDLSNVKVDLANIKSGLSNVCGNLRNAASTISNGSITIPQLASFQLPDGLHSHTDTINLGFTSFGVQVVDGLSFHTVSVGPQTISSPFPLAPITCPAL